jgi:hypothetical protein
MSKKNLKPTHNTLSQSKTAGVSLVTAIVLIAGFLLWRSDDGGNKQLNTDSATAVKETKIKSTKETKVEATDLAEVGVQALPSEPSEVDSRDDVTIKYFNAVADIGFYPPGTASYEEGWCEQWELNEEGRVLATAEFKDFLERNGQSLSEERDKDGRPLNYQSYNKTMLRQLGSQGDLTALLGLSLHPESSPEEKLWAINKSLAFGATAPVSEYAVGLVLGASARGDKDWSDEYIEAFAWADVAARLGDISTAVQLLGSLDNDLESARTDPYYRPKLISDDDWHIVEQRADDIFGDIEIARSDLSLPPLNLTQPKPVMRFNEKLVGGLLLADLSGKLPLFAKRYISGTNCIEKARQYAELAWSPLGRAMWNLAENNPPMPIDR